MFVFFPLKADEMPDLPTQSVTEEKYKDENGHIVVKKVKHDLYIRSFFKEGSI